MSLYERYETSPQLEKTGIVADFTDFRVKLARAGGSNTAFQKRMEFLTKPYRRMISSGNIDIELIRKLTAKAYAETVILDWETLVDREYVSGIETKDGAIMPVTPELVESVLLDLPDLFVDIQEYAQNASLFRADILEHDAKN